MKKVGFIGLGFVGNAVREAFRKHFSTSVYDVVPEKSTTASVEILSETCDLIFVALPTPIDPQTGICDYDIIENTLAKLNKTKGRNLVVLKSSVAPGKTAYFQKKYQNLKLVFNPEFLTERNAVEDFKNQDKIILGGTPEATSMVKDYYEQVFPNAKIYQTTTTAAEMTKFVINCFLATKVSFFNEMYQVCNKLDIDYDEVLNLTLTDKRIGSSHTKVPGWDGFFGYGGSCFPANINIMINEVIKLGVEPEMLKAAWKKNLEVRPEKDWELLEGRCVVKK
jgi:UDPglucose 6-dehydrogenase